MKRHFCNYRFIPIALLVAAALAMIWYIVRSNRSIVVIQVDDLDGVTQIKLESDRISHDPVIDVHAMSAKTVLWVVTIEHNFFKNPHFVCNYDEPPQGGKQSIPANNDKPRPLIEGELLYITVRFGIDSMLSAGMGEMGFEVRYVRNGKSVVTAVPTKAIPLE